MEQPTNRFYLLTMLLISDTFAYIKTIIGDDKNEKNCWN